MTESVELCSATCIGLPEWTDRCRENAERRVLEVEDSQRQSPGSSHFGYINEETAEQLSHGFIPRNTELNTKWAVTNFLDWTNWKNGRRCT
jgi:hypothetical protein